MDDQFAFYISRKSINIKELRIWYEPFNLSLVKTLCSFIILKMQMMKMRIMFSVWNFSSIWLEWYYFNSIWKENDNSQLKWWLSEVTHAFLSEVDSIWYKAFNFFHNHDNDTIETFWKILSCCIKCIILTHVFFVLKSTRFRIVTSILYSWQEMMDHFIAVLLILIGYQQKNRKTKPLKCICCCILPVFNEDNEHWSRWSVQC